MIEAMSALTHFGLEPSDFSVMHKPSKSPGPKARSAEEIYTSTDVVLPREGVREPSGREVLKC